MTPLPTFCTPLPDADAMRATDAWAISERGIAGSELMERAGAGLLRVVEGVAPDGPVVVVCGKGNNGGDGFVVARLLGETGREVRVLLAGEAADLQGDAAAARECWTGPVEPFSADALAGAAVFVDALLGTGFSGEPRGVVAEAIAALGAAEGPIVACDVPSGVDASTGEIADQAVRAVATATFHAAKPGLWIAPGKEHAGEVHVMDIGIPRGAPAGSDVGLIGLEATAALPARSGGSTKFTSGHVLVCGGSRGLTGAPVLAARAAMRAGAGYVTACVPASLEPIFEVKLTEVMTRGLPDEDGSLGETGTDTVLAEIEKRAGSLVLGPGIGAADGAHALARDLAARAAVPLVLDADGLNAHAGRLDSLAARAAPTVLTPHAGELGRLVGEESAAIGARRLHHAREAARRSGAIVVLKGDDTLVADPEGRVAVSPGGAGALATAGTGDVLSGVIGAALARGLAPFEAACAAVELHRRAGRRAARDVGAAEGVVAGDVVDALPHAVGDLS